MSSKEKSFLSIRDICEEFEVDYKTIYRAITGGELPSSRIGAMYRVTRADLEVYLKRKNDIVKPNREEPAAPPLNSNLKAYAQTSGNSPASRPVASSPSASAKPNPLEEDRIDVFSPEEEQSFLQIRLDEAKEQLRNKQIELMMTSLQAKQREINAINRFERKLRELVSLRLPMSLISTLINRPLEDDSMSATVRLTNPAQYISNQDNSEQLMTALNTGFLEQSLLDRMPLNPSKMLSLPTALISQYLPSGLKAMSSFLIELRLWSDLNAYANDGFVTTRISQTTLFGLITEAARQAEEVNCAHILAIASPVGWTQEAIDFISNELNPVDAYTHTLLMPVLVDLGRNIAFYNKHDSRIEPFVGLFTPVMRDERIAAAAAAIQENVRRYEYVPESDMPKLTEAPNDIWQAAVSRMLATGRYAKVEVKGIGTVLKLAQH
ncbi:MAG: helix-turn-helix domain-containing protein [Anaerolineae bacterium]|nr:helix-turn-helix domain-containing protein [Anaerolineae bacterium]